MPLIRQMELAGGGAGELVEKGLDFEQVQRQAQRYHDDVGEAAAAVAEEAPSPMETGTPPEQGNDAGATGGGLVQPTLFSYIANDLVWARAGTKGNEPFWPVRSHFKKNHFPRAFFSPLFLFPTRPLSFQRQSKP